MNKDTDIAMRGLESGKTTADAYQDTPQQNTRLWDSFEDFTPTIDRENLYVLSLIGLEVNLS